MVAIQNSQGQSAHAHLAHPEETFSILMALGGAVGAIGFFWLDPTFEPESHIAWAIPGWIAGAYLFVQILFLLVSATQIRALGVLDTIISIVPVVVGLVLIIEWLLGHVPLSLFQLNALGLLIATSLAEFLLTVWIRFVLNRRTIAIDSN
jgi:hypothetical protein